MKIKDKELQKKIDIEEADLAKLEAEMTELKSDMRKLQYQIDQKAGNAEWLKKQAFQEFAGKYIKVTVDDGQKYEVYSYVHSVTTSFRFVEFKGLHLTVRKFREFVQSDINMSNKGFDMNKSDFSIITKAQFEAFYAKIQKMQNEAYDKYFEEVDRIVHENKPQTDKSIKI